MFDPKKLLNDLLGSGVPGTGSTVRDGAGKAVQMAKDNPLAAGALAAAGAAAGAGALFAVYLLLALISPAGMGMGDVKLAAVLGLYGGWAGAAAWMGTLLGGFLLGGLAGVAVLAARRGSRGSTFPFGPGMLAAAFASFVLLG